MTESCTKEYSKKMTKPSSKDGDEDFSSNKALLKKDYLDKYAVSFWISKTNLEKVTERKGIANVSDILQLIGSTVYIHVTRINVMPTLQISKVVSLGQRL